MLTLFAFRELTNYLYWLLTDHAGSGYQIRELKEHNVALWVFVYWADIIYVFIALGVYLSFKYFKRQTHYLQIQNLQKDLELKQLNQQLNPHFLFNALNNIYSHLMRKSSDGKELILMLSELMQYILNSNKKETVPLAEEIAFIENYIAFEHERLGERCKINFKKAVDTTGFSIVPLVLFNFVENAFKHGTNSIERSVIFIDIRSTKDILQLQVLNPKHNNDNHSSTKTGLNNAIRRLDLLYADQYTLDISESSDDYNVKLTLKHVL